MKKIDTPRTPRRESINLEALVWRPAGPVKNNSLPLSINNIFWERLRRVFLGGV
jgi:hypothetical protein